MPLEDLLRTAVDRALAESTSQLGRALLSLAADISGAVAEERRLQQADTQRLLDEAREAGQKRMDTAVLEAHQRLERLTQSVRQLDAARSLGDLLDALAEGAAREAERTALFVTNRSRLQGWRLSGFEEPLVARSLDLAEDEAGVLRTAVHEHGAGARRLTDADPLPIFLRSTGPRERAVVPVIVDGTAVALLYADAATTAAAPAPWSSGLELLARHAGRALEVLTLQRVAGLSPIAPAAAPQATRRGTVAEGQVQ